MKYTKKLLKDGTFVDYISRSCVGSDDVLYMKISADDKEECLIVRSNNISAMSRATAHSCVAFIRALADGFVEDNGVMAPEILAQNDDFYSYIMDILASYGIMFREQNKVNYPFWK